MPEIPSKHKIPLPPRDTRRWVKSRKMAVIQAIEAGYLSDDEACARYELSIEELSSWKRLARRYGAEALRTTHLKEYRETYPDFLLIEP